MRPENCVHGGVNVILASSSSASKFFLEHIAFHGAHFIERIKKCEDNVTN
jgi:hypothetical protein